MSADGSTDTVGLGIGAAAPAGSIASRDIGDVLLSVKNVSLSFGGVKAIQNVSFDIQASARSGQSSARTAPARRRCSTCINGFYHPQEGTITYRGAARKQMKPYIAATQGIARTFQNVALFRGMSTLDNIMSGRTLKMNRGLFWQILRFGPADERGDRAPPQGRRNHRLPRNRANPPDPGRPLPYGLQKRVELGRALAMEPTCCCSMNRWLA
jgi:branched-chain amino acid transport system ATP-binding protein